MAPTAGTGPPPRRGGRAAVVLGILALVLGVLALTLGGFGVFGVASAATPNMRGFNPGATVTVTDSGLSVYARSDGQRAGTVCRAVGEKTTVLDRPTERFSVEVAGSDFYEVARGPEELPAGSYTLTCEGTQAALYVGPAAPSTSASGLAGVGGVVGGVLLGFLAVLLGVAALLVRLWSRGWPGQSQSFSAAQPGYSSPYAAPPPPPPTSSPPTPPPPTSPPPAPPPP